METKVSKLVKVGYNRWKTFYSICQMNVNGAKLYADEVEATLYYNELADTIFDQDYGTDQSRWNQSELQNVA